MEQKLNIAEILRNKPCGIRLYSPIFGDCTFCYIKDETSSIIKCCLNTTFEYFISATIETLKNKIVKAINNEK